jgi:hypothetical protein
LKTAPAVKIGIPAIPLDRKKPGDDPMLAPPESADASLGVPIIATSKSLVYLSAVEA